MAFLFHDKKVKRGVWNNFHYFTKIVMPEERAMAVADKQHQILLKIQIYREIKSYA